MEKENENSVERLYLYENYFTTTAGTQRKYKILVARKSTSTAYLRKYFMNVSTVDYARNNNTIWKQKWLTEAQLK